MTVPSDLTVDIRGGRLWLSSQGRDVEVDLGRCGPFHAGPIAWTRLLAEYLAPALSQLLGGDGRDGCRFSEGWDPSFSKPFPPELFPRLTAFSLP